MLSAYREWTAGGLPEEVTSIGRTLQLPDLEIIPEIVRGKSFSIVEAAYLGGEAEGAELLEPLRELGPVMDTFAMVPPAALAELHMDPIEPVPYDEHPRDARRAHRARARRGARRRRAGRRIAASRSRSATPAARSRAAATTTARSRRLRAST